MTKTKEIIVDGERYGKPPLFDKWQELKKLKIKFNNRQVFRQRELAEYCEPQRKRKMTIQEAIESMEMRLPVTMPETSDENYVLKFAHIDLIKIKIRKCQEVIKIIQDEGENQ